jgi:flavin-binding protein dodecin
VNGLREEDVMTDSVYKLIELIGTSTESWEKAASNAVETASKTLQDIRVAEVVELDMVIENGKVQAYRAKIKLSFKYKSGE